MKHGFRLEDMIGVLMALARLLGDHQEVAALEGSSMTLRLSGSEGG